MDWRARGLCLRRDPDLFFPIGSVNSGPVAFQTDEAKAVCRRCPVTEQCLAWAVDAGPVEGIWGGTTEGERRAMQRRAARESAATETAA
ncbi:WhiB family transcriptional regulator [Streptomyces chromofuscus]|uniref:Transcriptional regulator WhiB n=1 Tax=Streptomyces chromofuscus TaxID=42881 RepID=A0A7M2TAD6_STRCW|nr:WhiB family transcriptional regulator [Streptomyces chromofuscus]QOV45194.1 WhiB family transcriptional regulator [Streptomyces chromofuscus]GGS99621.1 transcriptional regulator WhiB [Streptomyces chromofuscus]